VILVAVFTLALTAGASDNRLRDREAVYLVDLPDYQPLILKVEKLSGVYATRSLNGHVRNVIPGEKVELIAYHPDAYFIKEVGTGSDGWVASKDLSSVSQEKLDLLMAQVEEMERIEKAIDENQVIPGMSLEHVERSLGKPTETAFRQDSSGRTDIWKYIEYKRDYETELSRDRLTGRIVRRTIPIQIPVNELSVEFKERLVVGIEKKSLK